MISNISQLCWSILVNDKCDWLTELIRNETNSSCFVRLELQSIAFKSSASRLAALSGLNTSLVQPWVHTATNRSEMTARSRTEGGLTPCACEQFGQLTNAISPFSLRSKSQIDFQHHGHRTSHNLSRSFPDAPLNLSTGATATPVCKSEYRWCPVSRKG